MALNTIYDKTTRGRLEIKDRSGGLSVIQRRILILVDGRRTAEKILRISKVVDYEKVLRDLEEMGLIESTGETGKATRPVRVAPAPSQTSAPRAGPQGDPKNLMLSTLQSYASPVKTADLVSDIQASENNTQLRELLDRWYQAVSDNPYAAPIVDDLRSSLLEQLLQD